MSSIMRALKYAATWLAFLTFHIDTRAAKRCAEQSAALPFHLLDPIERRMVAWLCLLAICSLGAAAFWIFGG